MTRRFVLTALIIGGLCCSCRYIATQTGEDFDRQGSISYLAGDYDRALQYYTRAIELDSASAVLYYSRGTVYYKIKNYEAAMEDHTKAIQLDPNYDIAY